MKYAYQEVTLPSGDYIQSLGVDTGNALKSTSIDLAPTALNYPSRKMTSACSGLVNATKKCGPVPCRPPRSHANSSWCPAALGVLGSCLPRTAGGVQRVWVTALIKELAIQVQSLNPSCTSGWLRELLKNNQSGLGLGGRRL